MQFLNPPKADKHYTQAFINQTSVVVNHNLNKRPAVTLLDSAGTEFECDVDHTTLNQCTISWSGLFSGSVTCN